MRKSGLADSPFFQRSSDQAPPPAPDRPAKMEEKPSRAHEQVSVKQTENRDPVAGWDHDTVVPRYHDATVEAIRKAVRSFGKEAATHRFTAEEKRAIADMIHAFRNRGIRTTENEIARIAINHVLGDYLQYGEDSLLERVLRALNS